MTDHELIMNKKEEKEPDIKELISIRREEYKRVRSEVLRRMRPESDLMEFELWKGWERKQFLK